MQLVDLEVLLSPERGTQCTHTRVLMVFVNDAVLVGMTGTDDIPTGFEKIKIVDGPIIVHYGSASMGGTVDTR